MIELIASITYWSLLLLLCLCCYSDIRYRKLPNCFCLLILALGFLNLIIQPMEYKPEIVLLRIFYVFLVFILGCFIYRLGCLGGGDIKLIASLSIWFTPNNLVTFLILMTMFGGFLAGLSILYNQIVVLFTSKLLAHKKITTLPYGIAITASATILLI